MKTERDIIKKLKEVRDKQIDHWQYMKLDEIIKVMEDDLNA